MTIVTASMSLQTKGNTEIQNITGGNWSVSRNIRARAPARCGFCPSSPSLTTVEFEPACGGRPLKRMLTDW